MNPIESPFICMILRVSFTLSGTGGKTRHIYALLCRMIHKLHLRVLRLFMGWSPFSLRGLDYLVSGRQTRCVDRGRRWRERVEYGGRKHASVSSVEWSLFAGCTRTGR